jgi:hypothetical protein
MNSNRLGWMEHQAQGSIIRSRRRNYLSISGVQDGKVVCIEQSSSFRGVVGTHPRYHPHHFPGWRLQWPFGGYGYGFGHGGVGLIGTILIIVVVLVLIGRV